MLQKKDNVLFKDSIFKVVQLFFENPNKTYHIRLLEKETGISTTAVAKAVDELHNAKIVKIDNTPLTKNITADMESGSYRDYKIVFNLYRLKQTGLLDGLLKKFPNPKAVVLFGSYAKGEDIEESDIDILVIFPEKTQKDLKILTGSYEKMLKRKINLHVLPDFEKSSSEFRNAAANGIVLHGYLKII